MIYSFPGIHTHTHTHHRFNQANEFLLENENAKEDEKEKKRTMKGERKATKKIKYKLCLDVDNIQDASGER